MNSTCPRRARGWAGRGEEAQVAVEFASHYQLLLIATGQRAGGHVGRRRPDVVLLDGLERPLAGRPLVPDQSARVRLGEVVGQDQVVGQREGQHEPEAVSVGGHERQAQLVDFAGAHRRHVVAFEQDLPAARAAQADDRLDQLVLAVASDARDTEDLARADVEARQDNSRPRSFTQSFT